MLDTVFWAIWHLTKIVPDMTYNVFGGTLNPTLLLLPSQATVCWLFFNWNCNNVETWSSTTFCWMPRDIARSQTLACAKKECFPERRRTLSVAHLTTLLQKYVNDRYLHWIHFAFFCNYRSQGGYVICDRLILTLGVLFNQALGHFIFRLNLSFKPNRNLDA